MPLRIPAVFFHDTEKTGGPLILAPLALIVAVPLIDHLTASTVHLLPLLAVAPAFTAAFAGPRVTGTIAVLAVMAQIAAASERHVLSDDQVVVDICSLVAISVLLVLFCAVRDIKQRQLDRARMISDRTQRAMLRPLPRRAGPLDVATEYRPAESDTRLGGDLFALARTAHSTRLLIGDVRGKGLDSINDLSIMVGAFRAAAHRQSPLPELVAYLEGSVHWGLAELSTTETNVGERFVTAAVADVPDHDPVIHLVSCGHPPALLLAGGTCTELTVPVPAPPLGLGGLSGASYPTATFPFPVGAQVLLYTDGLSEARDRTGAFYPLAERLVRCARAAAPEGRTDSVHPAALVAHLVDDLLTHTGGTLDDDMAMIAVRRRPDPDGKTGSQRTD